MSEFEKYNSLTNIEIIKIINDIIDLHHSERKVSDELIFNELNLKKYLKKLLKNREKYNWSNNNFYLLNN